MSQADLNGSNANSSDFVKKLYKMLEDKTHDDVVRWGNDGDSFVVLENEQFTKAILPKNFKHSNFASFVRQLNKYDFHKVRQTNEDSGQSQYGPGAWEFKHPDFQANNKDALDNIRRKAPAPRKANSSADPDVPTTIQQVDLMQTLLHGTQHQLQSLQERYDEMYHMHVNLLNHVVTLQRFVKAHDGIMHRLIPFLQGVDQERRTSLRAGLFTNGHAGGMGIPDLVAPGQDDHPASPLQQASQLLEEFNAENLISKELEQRAINYTFDPRYSTPPDYSNSVTMAPTPGGSSGQLGFASMRHADLMENLVYPMGHSNGIDPIDPQHIGSIPYGLPTNDGALTGHHPNEMMSKSKMDEKPKKGFSESTWGARKPRILLVEDDVTCARIGMKFLESFHCSPELASDGLEAVQKVNLDGSFDLILMDIIMPQLDGISAASCIREAYPNPTGMPIVAMTSNIRTEDIEMYFRYGMNDVLPKPFTKEGMLRALEKHLNHLRKQPLAFPNPGPTGPHQVSGAGGAMFNTPVGSSAPLNLNMNHISSSIKEENSPGTGKSPASSSWHSPGQMGASPQSVGVSSHYGTATMSAGGMSTGTPMSAGGFSITPTHPNFHPVMNGTGGMGGEGGARQFSGHRRGLSEMEGIGMMGPGSAGGDEYPEAKRQRMYPPGGQVQGGFAG